MTNNKTNGFRKKLEFAIIQPLNVVLEGEDGVGKEYFAKLIHEERVWAKDFIIFDWENDRSRQFRALEDLVKNHLTEIISFGKQERNTYFFRRIDLLSSQIQMEIFELLNNEAKRFGLSRSQLHQLSLIASREKKNGNGNRQDDLTFNPLLELFPLRVKVPALRQRKKELISLMYIILESVNRHQRRKVLGFSPETFNFFFNYDWPSNIDELRSEIEREVALTMDNDLIKPGVLSERLIKHQAVLRTGNFTV